MGSQNCLNKRKYPVSCNCVNRNDSLTCGLSGQKGKTAVRQQQGDQDVQNTVAVQQGDTDSSTATRYDSILMLVWFTVSKEHALFFLKALHVGKSFCHSQLHEGRPPVSACSPKPQKPKEEIARGVGTDKNREAKLGAGGFRTVPHEATWGRSQHQGCGLCCKLTDFLTTTLKRQL